MRWLHRTLRWQQALLLGLLLISGWQSQSIHAATGPTVSVAVSDFQFTPVVTTIPVGSTVSWTNSGSLSAHNLRADDGSFSSGAPTTQFTFERQFDTPGTYRYYCILHGAPGGVGMSGQIVVTFSPSASIYLPLVVRT